MPTKTTTQTTRQNLESSREAIVKEMMAAGLHFGHKKSRWNPGMAPYVFGVRNNVHIIDLNKTYEKLQEALAFLTQAAREGRRMVLVGTRPQARQLTQETAQKTGIFYVVNRWIGGTLTNFQEIQKRLQYFRDLLGKKQSGELEKYTKKEQLDFDKELEALERKWGGLKDLKDLPEVLIVLDAAHDRLAIKEAREKGVKIVAITDTNADPTGIDYPIPANDDAISSLKYILKKMEEAILKGRSGETTP